MWQPTVANARSLRQGTGKSPLILGGLWRASNVVELASFERRPRPIQSSGGLRCTNHNVHARVAFSTPSGPILGRDQVSIQVHGPETTQR